MALGSFSAVALRRSVILRSKTLVRLIRAEQPEASPMECVWSAAPSRTGPPARTTWALGSGTLRMLWAPASITCVLSGRSFATATSRSKMIVTTRTRLTAARGTFW